jgi:hypothetical protein
MNPAVEANRRGGCSNISKLATAAEHAPKLNRQLAEATCGVP